MNLFLLLLLNLLYVLNRLSITPEPEKYSDFFASVFGSQSKIFLVPMPPVNVGFLESLFILSKPLGIMERDYIISAKYPIKKSSFTFLLAFEPIVWIVTLMMLFALGIFYSKIDSRIVHYRITDCWWYLSSPLFHHQPIPTPRLPKTTMARLLLFNWFFAAFVLLSGFSGNNNIISFI